MDIKFKRLHIENFMSIGEAEIELPDRGFTLIEGINRNNTDNARSNGSGKSSIFEALVWVLTGSTIRGNKDVVNYNGTDGTFVKLELIIDNNSYCIVRTKEHSKYKTNLIFEINGVDRSGKGIKDTEKILSEYLPDLTSSLIGSVIVLGQGLPQKFSNNSPSGRKEILEKLFKSDYMIQDLKNRVSQRRAELNDELREVQDKRLVNLTKIETLTDTINTNKARYSQLEDMSNLESEADLLNKELLELRETSTSLSDNIQTYNIKRNETIDSIAECKVEKAEIIETINKEYESTLEFANEGVNTSRVALELAKKELDRINNIKDVCPTCGQKLPDIHKPDNIKARLELEAAQKENQHWNAQLSKINKEIEQKKLSSTGNLSDNIILLENQSIELLNEINRLKQQYNDNEKLLKNKTDIFNENMTLQKNRLFEMETLRESIEKNQVIIDNLVLDNKELDEKEIIINDRIAIQNKFNTALTRDFRGYLLNDIIVYINSKAKEFCKDVFNTDLIEFKLDGNNIVISYDNKEYEALSGGERQKIDLIIQFAIRDMLCRHTSFSSNIIVLDEIFDNLDDVGCQKILDLITTKLYDISSIFIITHHGNELNVPYDNKISIIKENNGVTSIVSL